MTVWIVTLNCPQGEYSEDIEQYIGVAATLDDAKEIVRKRESVTKLASMTDDGQEDGSP